MRGKHHCILVSHASHRITPARAGKTYLLPVSSPACRDHPRACGENARIKPCDCMRPGSPPRVRGKLLEMVAEHREMRITPARAGKTAAGRSRQAISQDHPRACGENTKRGRRTFLSRGSPPRVRGKPELNLNWKLFLRITPARAGKTFSSHSIFLLSEDHPRACGENRA